MQTEEKKEHAPQLTPEEQAIYDHNLKPTLDLSLVHQKAIPGIWNQCRFSTFPCNWLVIGHLPGDVRTKMVLQGEGPGGVKDVARHLNDDEIQYAGFRVTITIDATIMQVINEPKDVFVIVKWIGKHTTTQQRANIDQEMLFMKSYFHNHQIDIPLVDFEVGTSDGTERIAVLTSHLKQIIMSQIGKKADSATQARALQFDFENANHVSVCTHYDTLEPNETQAAANAAMTHDALFNAMSAVNQANEEEGGEEVPYYNEAKERYDDRFAEEAAAAAAAARSAGMKNPTEAEMEGENLQYDYNTFDLDHGEEEATLRLNPVAESGTTSTTSTTTTTTENNVTIPPPAPSTASFIPSGMEGTGQVPLDETDMLVLERLKVEEESLILRRQLAAIQQERDRQSSKQRIQERLKERRARKQLKEAGAQNNTNQSIPPETKSPTNDFFTSLDKRATDSKNRLAARLATRGGSSEVTKKSKDLEEHDDIADGIAEALAHRQSVMAERLKEVEARIQSNNTSLTGEK